MSSAPSKVLIALDSISNAMQSICVQSKKAKATEIFFIFDTMLTFKDPIFRAIGKADYMEIKASVQSTMRLYARYIDHDPDVTRESVNTLANKSHELIYMLTTELRED